MTKPRKSPSQRMRARLQREIGSECPFCGSQEVDTFEVHHLNEDPSDDRFENELMVCPICHAKITAGTISRDETMAKKVELAKCTKEEPSDETARVSSVSMRDVGFAIVGNNNRVTTVTPRKQVVKYPPDCIGGNSLKANYISYLVERYQKLASWNRPNFSYAVFPTQLKRRFKIGSQRTIYNLTLDRFGELAAYIQDRILNTQIGRMRRGTQKLFSSFEEYCADNSNHKS